MIVSPLKWNRVFYMIFGFIGLVLILDYGGFIFIPMVWAIFIACALVPVTNALEQRRIPRLMAIIISLLLLTLIVLLVVYIFIVQLGSLITDFPAIGKKIQLFVTQIETSINQRFGLEHALKNLDFGVLNLINTKNVDIVWQFTTTTITTLTLLPVFIFLFLYYQDFFKEFLARIRIDTSNENFTWMSDAILIVRKYLAGLLVVTFIVSILASVMFYFLGIKYYLLFGLFTAVCNLIPYIGVILGSIITVIYVLLTTDQLWYPLVCLILLWLLQVIENNLITPIVVGAKIRLNPLAVILAIFSGGALWGVSGMILFIPIVGIIKIFFDKSANLQPYGYLLGDEIPIHETKENFVSYMILRLRRRFSRQVRNPGQT